MWSTQCKSTSVLENHMDIKLSTHRKGIDMTSLCEWLWLLGWGTLRLLSYTVCFVYVCGTIASKVQWDLFSTGLVWICPDLRRSIQQHVQSQMYKYNSNIYQWRFFFLLYMSSVVFHSGYGTKVYQAPCAGFKTQTICSVGAKEWKCKFVWAQFDETQNRARDWCSCSVMSSSEGWLSMNWEAQPIPNE